MGCVCSERKGRVGEARGEGREEGIGGKERKGVLCLT
jgi:hypothetical protein